MRKINDRLMEINVQNKARSATTLNYTFNVHSRFKMKMKVFKTFILHFARLALLCFAKVGCGSEMKMKVFKTFILHFARLALPLHTIITLKINISVSIWKRLISWT